MPVILYRGRSGVERTVSGLGPDIVAPLLPSRPKGDGPVVGPHPQGPNNGTNDIAYIRRVQGGCADARGMFEMTLQMDFNFVFVPLRVEMEIPIFYRGDFFISL